MNIDLLQKKIKQNQSYIKLSLHLLDIDPLSKL